MDGLYVRTHLFLFPIPSNTTLNSFPIVNPRGWLGTNLASVDRSSGNDRSSGKSTAGSFVYAYVIALVGGKYQLAGDLEWESRGGCRIPITINVMAVCIKVCGDLPMLSCDTIGQDGR